MLSLAKFLKGLRLLNDADQTKQAELSVDNASTTNTKTTLNLRQTANRTLSVPNDAVTGELLTNASTQTITGKTIVAASNTITTAPSGNLTSTEINAALAELQSDIDTRATSIDLSNHTSASTGVHGVTGNVVGTSDSQVLTNKTIDASLNTLSNINVASLTGTLPILNGGTGQTTASAAFNALSPTTTKADIIVHNGTTNVRLPIGLNGQVLTADSAEPSGIKWAPGGGGGGGPSTAVVQRFSGDGTTVAFVLSNDPVVEENTQIYISGVYQQKDTYSVTTSTITFSEAPPAGTNNIEVLYFTGVNLLSIANDSVTTAAIQNDAVTTAKIADNSITNSKMADNSVNTAELVDNSVTTQKIANNAITNDKMADNSVGTSEIVDGGVTTSKIADGAVTNAKRSAPLYAESSVSNLSATTTGYVTLATISSFTSTGKRCIFGLRNDVDGSYLQLTCGSSSGAEARLRVYDVTNSVVICSLARLRLVGATGGSLFLTLPSTITALSAGTREIRIEGRLEVSGSGQALNFNSLVFYAQEL